MAQKRTSSKKTTTKTDTRNGKVLRVAGRTIRALPVTWISLGLNAVLLLTFFTLIGWTHIHSFWFAERLNKLHHNVCPVTVASNVEQHEENGAVFTTYTVSDQALKSGCAAGLLQNAALTDYMFHPDHAKKDGDSLLKVSPKGLPMLTIVKSANGQQLAPSDY
jgi:hypothetical protein